MTVHVGTHGLCNECESERAWENSKRIVARQRYSEYRNRVYQKKSKELKERAEEFERRGY